MSTLRTAFPSFPEEGETPLNTLKNCAKTALSRRRTWMRSMWAAALA